MNFQSSYLLLLYDFNRFIPALYGQLFLFWSKLQPFPYMGVVSFFGVLGANFNTFLFFSYLFRVITPDTCRFARVLRSSSVIFSDKLSAMLIPGNNFSRQCVTIKREFVQLDLFSQTSTLILVTSF